MMNYGGDRMKKTFETEIDTPVEDVARVHILAAKKGRIGERYLFGNENTTVSNYFKLIAEVAGLGEYKKDFEKHLEVTHNE
jgi:dihydroflavonol-4-reductase